MKVDLDRKLIDARGKEFTDGATVGMAAYNALQVQLPTDSQQSMDQGYKRWKLLQALGAGGVQELTAEDVAEIKKRALAGLGIVAFGALADALEGKAEVVQINTLAPEAKTGEAA